MLGKCAAAAAYRAAFPELFGGLYTSDEVEVNRNRNRPPAEEAAADEPIRSAGEVASSIAAPAVNPPVTGELPDDPRVVAKLIDETTPDLPRLPMELVLSGPCSNIKEAMGFIDSSRRKWPRLFAGHPEAFCAAVMDAARRQLQAA